MPRNAQLLYQIADTIERLPWAYDQGEWCAILEPDEIEPPEVIRGETDCGTRMCIAGWAADLTGWVPDIGPGMSTSLMRRKGDNDPAGMRAILDIAAEALGLEDGDLGLFDGDWDPETDRDVTVPEALRAIAAGAPIHGPYDDYDWLNEVIEMRDRLNKMSDEDDRPVSGALHALNEIIADA